MRILAALPFLALTGCGLVQAAPEVPFASVKGRIVAVKDQCELVFPDGKAGSTGPCNDILPRSRTQENRAATVYRKLGLTYAYTAPSDGQMYQAKNDLQQPMSSHVPRVGEEIDVMVHPEQPLVTRLP